MADRDAERADRDEAVAWLGKLLADGPVRANDAYAAADAAGLSKDRAKRAKKRIGAVAAKAGMSGPWYWALAEHEGDLDHIAEGSANSAGDTPLHPSLSSADDGEENGR